MLLRTDFTNRLDLELNVGGLLPAQPHSCLKDHLPTPRIPAWSNRRSVLPPMPETARAPNRSAGFRIHRTSSPLSGCPSKALKARKLPCGGVVCRYDSLRTALDKVG